MTTTAQKLDTAARQASASNDSNRNEWEVRQARGRVNTRCACGAVPRTGVICDRCRASNEPEE